eukprot:1149760_1
MLCLTKSDFMVLKKACDFYLLTIMDFTTEDNAIIKLIVLIIIFGLGIHLSFALLRAFAALMFHGCCFLIKHFLITFVFIIPFLILLNLIGILLLCQKYISAATGNIKNKFKKQIGSLCFVLCFLCASELSWNTTTDTSHSRLVLLEHNNSSISLSLFYQIIGVLSFIIGVALSFKLFASPTWRKTRSFEKKPCPICMDDTVDGITITACSHSICLNNTCAYNYIKHSVSDITKYPITCFQHNCTTPIHADAIKYIIDHHTKHNLQARDECTLLLHKYNRFSVITSTPKHLRIDCPNANCINVLIKTQPPLNTQLSPTKYPMNHNHSSKHTPSRFKSLRKARHCASDLCTQSFSMLKWRYHCTICGRVFCHSCVRFKMQILELGYDEPVPLCMACFTNLFCVQCEDCKQMICYRCEEPWHNVCDKRDLENGMCKKIKNNGTKAIVDAKTKRLMKNSKFQHCPRCAMMIEKASGCNHMTHAGCPNKTESNGTHFCYSCGELLYGRFHNEERDGTAHFPRGVFYECRKAKKSFVHNCLMM